MAERAASGVEFRNPFAIDLFNYIWNKFNYAVGEIPNTAESEFTTEIGDAVVSMMVMTRDCLYKVLRNICIRSEFDAVNVTLKLCKSRRHFREHDVSDHFQLFLELCAIIAEVHLYCCSGKDYPFDDMVFISWNLVMKPKFMEKIINEGGWIAMYAYARYYKKTSDFIYESYGPFEYPYDEFPTIADIGEGFRVVAESFKLTFKNWHHSKDTWKEGCLWLHERVKLEKRIARLESKASGEKGALALTQSQIATQRKKLEVLESSGWTVAKVLKRIEQVSPYLTSEEEDAAAMKTSTKTSDNIPAASSSRKKRKQKKKKKCVKQEVAPSPPPAAEVAPSPPPAAEVAPSPPPAAEVAPSPPPAAEVAPSPPPAAEVAPSPPPAAEVAPSPQRARNQTSKKSRKKNK